MEAKEKEVAYNATNTYSTINDRTNDTKNVWFVCHGMGYLSRYFLKYFRNLPVAENYIIAPQAPSKYYSNPGRKHIGASWLTKENTVAETHNIMRYFDRIFESETLPETSHLIMLGYSQGVSVMLRYIASRKLQCQQILILSGGLPIELEPDDFSHLKSSTKVILSYGNNDGYLDEKRIAEETDRVEKLFGGCQLEILPFEGKHEVNIDLINSFGS